MEPTAKEKYCKKTAQLLQYVMRALNYFPVSISDVEKSINNPYSKNDYTATLCGIIRQLTPNEMNTIVYDGRNSEARALADWWDEHQKVDEKHQKDAEKEIERLKQKITEAKILIEKSESRIKYLES
jgi:hypothetical protein